MPPRGWKKPEIETAAAKRRADRAWAAYRERQREIRASLEVTGDGQFQPEKE